MKLQDTKAIVTGAARGMGRYFALQFATEGAQVVAADIDSEGLESLVAESSGAIHPIECDVTSEEAVAALIDDAYDKMDGLNVLVNNAGIFLDGLLVKKDRKTGDVKKMSLGQWQKVIDIDLTAPFVCTRDFAAKLIETDTKDGVVISMSSVARHGSRGQSNYSAAKAGLIADTKLWSIELSRFGIRTGAIAPGFIETPILQAMRPEVLEGLVKTVPLRRIGKPHDIWLGIKFIIECNYFTGRCLDIDGGLVV